MKELTLTCAKQRMIRGETQYNRVSRFVREIPRELVDLGHTIQEKKPRVDDIVSPKSAYAQMKMNFQAKTSLQKKTLRSARQQAWITVSVIRYAM